MTTTEPLKISKAVEFPYGGFHKLPSLTPLCEKWVDVFDKPVQFHLSVTDSWTLRGRRSTGLLRRPMGNPN